MFLNIFKLYPSWTCWAWIAWMLGFAVLEVLGLFRVRGAIPLTWTIRDTLPEWAIWPLLGWLMYHFGIVTNIGQPRK